MDASSKQEDNSSVTEEVVGVPGAPVSATPEGDINNNASSNINDTVKADGGGKKKKKKKKKKPSAAAADAGAVVKTTNTSTTQSATQAAVHLLGMRVTSFCLVCRRLLVRR
jgi:hypothetical protein